METCRVPSVFLDLLLSGVLGPSRRLAECRRATAISAAKDRLTFRIPTQSIRTLGARPQIQRPTPSGQVASGSRRAVSVRSTDTAQRLAWARPQPGDTHDGRSPAK